MIPWILWSLLYWILCFPLSCLCCLYLIPWIPYLNPSTSCRLCWILCSSYRDFQAGRCFRAHLAGLKKSLCVRSLSWFKIHVLHHKKSYLEVPLVLLVRADLLRARTHSRKCTQIQVQGKKNCHRCPCCSCYLCYLCFPYYLPCHLCRLCLCP